MYDDRELTVEQIAGVLGVGRISIYRALRAQQTTGPGRVVPAGLEQDARAATAAVTPTARRRRKPAGPGAAAG